MKKIVLPFYFLVILLLLSIIFGYSLRFFSSNREEEMEENISLHKTGYTYISPLLKCADNQINVSKITTLKKSMQTFITKEQEQGKVEEIAVYFHNLSDDSWISINPNFKFSPASLLKVPLMIAYLKLAEYDPNILQQKLKVIPFDFQTAQQNIKPEMVVEKNKEYTIEELLQYAINYSDNQAANTLISYLDPNFINQVYTDLGLAIPGSESLENFMTVREYASFFEILYNASYLNELMSEKALEILTKSTFSSGLNSGLPENVIVAHKFGERIVGADKQLHDCGIIYMEKNPYLLCIMTKAKVGSSSDFSELERIISTITEKTYNYLNK
ncbi:MAG: beta-lactamase class [Patescibacteria group bacterium]|nr:beta-lactamase class [Patescibacteria group bacterium]